jgi:hypothetical protein
MLPKWNLISCPINLFLWHTLQVFQAQFFSFLLGVTVADGWKVTVQVGGEKEGKEKG